MNRFVLVLFSITCVLILWQCQLVLAGDSEAKTELKQSQEESKLLFTSEERPDYGQYFKEYSVNGCFLCYDQTKKSYVSFNPKRCETRFSPASTFKILNALIALETLVIPDEKFELKWDGAKRDIEAWNKDHTLATAMHDSVVWYFQELARRIGAFRMKLYVDKANYGNKDISGDVDKFWLNGTLKISPFEQVDFLRRFHDESLPFSQHSLQTVKKILFLEEKEGRKLYGKTGMMVQPELSIGWFVGFVEKDANTYFFATNIEGKKADKQFYDARKEITKKILSAMELFK